jgi:hypothetical protein
VQRSTRAAIIVVMRLAIGATSLLVGVTMAGCLPSGLAGTLEPTLSIAEATGAGIAMQNGIPVPDFGWQPRPRLDLDGGWLVERVVLDERLTMADRAEGLAAIESEADGRQRAEHVDDGWAVVAVPGTLNAPPEGTEGGAWYRRHFGVPADWADLAVTLRFGSANYVADVWLNGTWLGYHEGGSTPFAFELGEALNPGSENVLAVRVHTIHLGSRTDVIPWGLVDWWNYGGITGPVWLEAAPAAHVARADVVTHLDAIDIAVVLYRSRLAPVAAPSTEPLPSGARLRLAIYPATVDETNLLDPDPRALVRPGTQALSIARKDITLPAPGEAALHALSIVFGEADAWSPARPALYVLRVQLLSPLGAPADEPAIAPDAWWTTFGIRHVAVDPEHPRVLLNGEPVFFRGVGIHGEGLSYVEGSLQSGTPAQPIEDMVAMLDEAASIGADLLRTGHQPSDPRLLMLADRLGFAVWEEIPLYHASPLIFDRTLRRGLAQQMLREMALRDMNHPSVLFHGLANESTGGPERADALAELNDIDKAIDGTRLTGQAAYGWRPEDATQAPLDVAGFTMYHGVFYNSDPDLDTRRALRAAHEANPGKPILVLEFGRWADLASDEARQLEIFDSTYRAIRSYRADRPGGFVSAGVWWTLRDFATQVPGIEVEDFGLVRPDGSMRPAGAAAAEAFAAPAGRGSEQELDPELDRPRARPTPAVGDWTLVGYVGYALALSIGGIGLMVVAMTRAGGRATGRCRSRRSRR